MPKQLDHKCAQNNRVQSHLQLGAGKTSLVIQAECITMHSIHSPDYVFAVVVSIFISKTHNHSEHHPSAINTFTLLLYDMSEGVLCFHYSHMRIANDTYHIHTYDEPVPPALYYVSALQR